MIQENGLPRPESALEARWAPNEAAPAFLFRAREDAGHMSSQAPHPMAERQHAAESQIEADESRTKTRFRVLGPACLK